MAEAHPISVRVANPADVVGIARVHVDSWKETYFGLVPERYFGEEAFAARVRMWTQVLGTPQELTRVVVAERNKEIIGFSAVGSAVGPDAEHGFELARPLGVFTLYLLAKFHGTGAGQSLLDAVLGDQPAQLWVARDNPRARAFYARNGFEPDGVENVDPALPDLVEVRLVR